MCPDTQIATRFGCAEKNVARRLVLREERIGAALVDITRQQAARACQASALMTNGGQVDSIVRGRVPDKFVPLAIKTSFARRHCQSNDKKIAILHAAAYGLLS